MGVSPIAWSKRERLWPYLAVAAMVALGAGAAVCAGAANASTIGTPAFAGYRVLHRNNTSTPIKHLVVIYGENVSFDHYFGTYPYAANTDGTKFAAKPGTPKVNGLYTKITKSGPVGPLLASNPNEYNPQRLTPAEAYTSDQNHGYTPEQKAVNNGKMNEFVQATESITPAGGCGPWYCPPGIVMDYYDGNTVTGLWNYAQSYAMSDNDYDTTFGPSSPGAVNVTSGTTAMAKALNPSWDPVAPGQPTASSQIVDVNKSTGLGVLYSDEDPYYDGCSDNNHSTDGPLAALTGKNIGNLLNASHVTWGWFEGGFTPTSTSGGLPVCGSSHKIVAGIPMQDYVPHHDPFQFYASTANPDHLPPSSLRKIGYTDQANHQYGMRYFTDALNGTGGAHLPSVSYLKAPAYEDGHPVYSDPIDEQHFLVNTINQIERSRYWPSTAVVITWDDSDGWYDSAVPPVVNGSHDPLTDTAICTSKPITVGTTNDRCGYGQRLPLLVISPYTRENYVSDNMTDTTSIVKFIEDNWLHGERIPGSYDAVSGSLDAPGGVLDFRVRPHVAPVILNPSTGAVVRSGKPGRGALAP